MWNVTPQPATSQLSGDRQEDKATTDQQAENYIEGLNLACHFTLAACRCGIMNLTTSPPTEEAPCASPWW